MEGIFVLATTNEDGSPDAAIFVPRLLDETHLIMFLAPNRTRQNLERTGQAWGVYEVTQKKDTLLLQVETLDVAMIRGLLIAFNGRVTAGAGTKPYLSVTLQPDEKPLELLQSILKAMADILAAPPEENTGKK